MSWTPFLTLIPLRPSIAYSIVIQTPWPPWPWRSPWPVSRRKPTTSWWRARIGWRNWGTEGRSGAIHRGAHPWDSSKSGSRFCWKLGIMGILNRMIYSDMYCVIVIYIINIIYIIYIYYITLCYVINMIYVQYTTWYIIYTYISYYVWYVHDDNMINNDGLRKIRKSI